MFAATLFDYNGVLVDDEAVHLAAFRDALSPLSVTVSERDYFEKYIGFDDKGAFSAMLKDAGRNVTEPLLRELVERKRPLYLERARRELKVFDGAAEVVKRCAAHGPVGVVSGALRGEIELGLAILGITDQVKFVVAAEDAPHSKPHPQGYLLALARLSAEHGVNAPGEALVVEDTLAGIDAAKAAGTCCVAVAHSYPRARLLSSRADGVLDEIRQMDEAFLTRLHARRSQEHV